MTEIKFWKPEQRVSSSSLSRNWKWETEKQKDYSFKI